MMKFLNGDCMDIMKQYPDDYFDLAIVDPPYFSGPEKRKFTAGKSVRLGSVDCTEKPQSGKFQIEIISTNFLEFQKIKSFGV